MDKKSLEAWWPWYFFLAAFEGAVALAALLSIPSEGGISLARLALAGVLLAFCILWTYFGFRPPGRLDKLSHPAFIIGSALLALSLGLFLFFLRFLNPEQLLPIYERLNPLLWYALVFCVQSSLFLLFLRSGFHLQNAKQRKPIFLAALIAFCLLLVVFALIAVTKLGITKDPAYWGEPGVPILGWQFGLAILGGFCVLLFAFHSRHMDVILPIAIWGLAVLLWLSVPVNVLKNAFYVTIDPPTFQPFPYSDAGYYDSMAHSLLIGHPYQGQIPTRPLYIVFLVALHWVFGENYARILAGQTLVLALIPVILYFLGKKIHSRAAGVMVALLFIFRELTSLWISSNTRVSNTKMMLVDLPTLFLLGLSCLFVLRWLERKEAKRAFTAGGLLGLLLLLRTQSMLLLPFILLVALLVMGWRNKSFYFLVSFFLLGLLVAVSPWLIHNYLQTGKFAFDADFQYRVIASQYAYTGNLNIGNYDFENKGLAQILIEFALKDPKFVFGFIANHFLATEINGLLALPLIKPYPGLFESVNLYWVNWDGHLEWYNALLLIVYLAVIAFGLGAAWKRLRWAGLLPLVYNIGYILATAIGRFSGWRYDLPADWVPYFYFGIGIVELFGLGALLFGAEEGHIFPGVEGSRSPRSSPPWISLASLAVVFAFVGGLPWLAEKTASPRYADQSVTSLTNQLVSLTSVQRLVDASQIVSFAAQPNAVLQTGRLLYPRYYSKGAGASSAHPWPAYAIRDFPRIGFLLLNQGMTDAVFPTKRFSGPFPHGEDVIVLGCHNSDYIEVRLIVFPNLDASYLSEPLTEFCSF